MPSHWARIDININIMEKKKEKILSALIRAQSEAFAATAFVCIYQCFSLLSFKCAMNEEERDDDDGKKGELNLSQNANTAHNSGNSDISGCLKHALHVLWILLFFCTRIIYYIWEEYWKDMNIDIYIYINKNVQNNIQYLNKRISKTALFCTFFSSWNAYSKAHEYMIIV